MDKLPLKKYETQLATIWRLWSQARRFSKLLITTDLRNVGRIIQMGNMFLSNRKFWATNNPRYLASALKSYFSLRNDWLQESHIGSNTGLEVSGWADKDTFSRLRETLYSYRLRRVFRPDVWYRKGGTGGLFTGFVFKVDISDFVSAAQEIEKSLPEFHMRLPDGSVTMLDQKLGGRLESIKPLQQQRGLNWFSTYSVSPREFTWLVEAAADKEVSEIAISFYKQFGGFEFHGETLRCIAKYCLILGEIPPEITLNGWSMKEIEKPSWIYTDSSEGLNAEKKNSRVSPKYTKLAGVSVTNGGVLLTEKGFVDWDAAQSPCLDFVAGNSNFVIGTNANLRRCFVRDTEIEETVESGILVGSRVDSNWFHFLIETLPRLLILEDTLDKSIPIIISNRVPVSGVEALQILTSREIISVNPDSQTKIQNAFVPGPVIYHPDSQFMWGKLDFQDVNKDLLLKMRNIILLKIRPQPENHNRFWVRMSSNRSLLNTRRISAFLLRRGFDVEDPGAMSFEKQVQSIFGSDVVVGIGGALMSNFIFANSSSRIIVLVSNFGVSYLMPKLLANVSGARLTIIGGPPAFTIRSSSVISKLHLSFRVRVKSIRAALDVRT